MANYEAIASRLVEKNSSLADIVTNNPTDCYKPIKAHLTPNLLNRIGQAEGEFIKAHDLTWAIINHVQGVDSLDY